MSMVVDHKEERLTGSHRMVPIRRSIGPDRMITQVEVSGLIIMWNPEDGEQTFSRKWWRDASSKEEEEIFSKM